MYVKCNQTGQMWSVSPASAHRDAPESIGELVHNNFPFYKFKSAIFGYIKSGSDL
jgi:hypothetical protein